jgi:hypothetical protein
MPAWMRRRRRREHSRTTHRPIQPHIVVPRACGGPSTPRLLGLVTGISETVIASHRVGAERRPMTGSAKQSIVPHKGRMDCFASLAMTMIDRRPRSRGAIRPSYAQKSRANQRARGMPDARCTRRPVCKKVEENAHEHTGSAESIRHSLRNGFTAYNALSLATNSSCHHRLRIDGLAEPGRARKTSADLTSATDARTTRLHRTPRHRSSARR